MNPQELAKSKTEHAEQRAFFAWCNIAKNYGFEAACNIESYFSLSNAARLSGKAIPELHWIHAIHNQGHGDAIRGAKAKAEGVKAGIADIFWPHVVGHNYSEFVEHEHTYCGLYIEMKRENEGKVSVEQSAFARYCSTQGYAWHVCFGWKSAAETVMQYKNGFTCNWVGFKS